MTIPGAGARLDPSGHPTHMHRPQKITTALWFRDDAEQAIRFYLSVFDDGEIVEENRWGEGGPAPAGSLMAATFRIAGQELLAINGNTQTRFNQSMSLLVHCDTQREIDHYWSELSADGQGQCGWTTDRFGVTWQIVPRSLAAMLRGDAERSRRVGAAMMQMGKIDLAALQRAYDGE